jgi:hypothetical protein
MSNDQYSEQIEQDVDIPILAKKNIYHQELEYNLFSGQSYDMHYA